MKLHTGMKKYGFTLLTSILSALLAVFLYDRIQEPREVIIRETLPARYTNLQNAPDLLSRPATQPEFRAAPNNFVQAAQAATPAVVNIQSIQRDSRFDLWGSRSNWNSSAGSGVIIAADGYIVTNNHVIEDGNLIEVTLNDKRKFEATVVGTDPSTDLALLKIEAQDLPFLVFGDSDSLFTGEWVLAVGNPFNLESTVTAGIVSAKGRSIDILDRQDRIESFIQTDAAVNPGNSGGALVNTSGQLIGINTAIITRSGKYEGYSFAVPSNLAQKVILDLRDFGSVQRGVLGVFIDEITSERAAELQLPSVAGVYITRVTPGSAAADAGLKAGDVIVGINGTNTATLPEMQQQVGMHRPGNTIKVTYFRDGQLADIPVILKTLAGNTYFTNESDEDALRNMGFEVRNLSAPEKDKLKVSGVKVIGIFKGSIIERTNMEAGFVVTHVNKQAVTDKDTFIRLLRGERGQVMLEGVYENYPGEYGYSFMLE